MTRTTILVVEDEAIIALDLRMQLQEMGYEVVGTAETSEEAISLVKRHQPMLVLMDVMLKGMTDGIETAEILRRSMEIPVIFLTSYSDDATVARAARAAPYGYLTKPFQAKELRAGIEVALCKSQMERNLRESERWFASTLRCVQDGVIVTGQDGLVRFLNPAAEGMLACEAEAAIGRHVSDIVSFSDGPDEGNALVQALKESRIVGVAHARTLVDGTGQSLPVDESAGPILDEAGATLGGVMVLRNASERVRQEARLKASEERFRSAFAHAPLGMALISLDGRFLQVNDALCQLLGCTADWLKQQDHGALTDPQDAHHEQARLRELLGNASVVQFEKSYLHSRDARAVPTLVSASLMREGDEATCHLYQIHDLTVQKKAAEELARFATERMSHEVSEMASRAKSDFLARMSHEMRTPLNAVLGFAQLLQLQGAQAGPITSAYSEHIVQAGRHLLALVDDVLDLQSMTTGRIRLKMESLNLHDCVQMVQVLLYPSAESLEIKLEVNVPNEIKVQADATRLRQVLLNIGSNAIKYNVPRGRVSWQVEHLPEAKVRLTVGDTGPGMTAAQMSKLFEPFERLGQETSAIPGTGLGLVISQRLVQEMGGALTIESEPGVGTQVHLDMLTG